MSIAFVNSTTAQQETTGGGTLTLGVPAGIADGDILLAFVVVDFGSNVPAAPSGWTLLDSQATGPSVASYYRVASSEPASYNWTLANAGVGSMVAYSGVDTVNPINKHGGWNRTASSTTVTASSITPNLDGCMIVFAAGAGTTETYTGPSSYTGRIAYNDSGGFGSLRVADLQQSSAAATGAVTATLSAAANNDGTLIALAPPEPSDTDAFSAADAESSLTVSLSDSETGTLSESESVSSSAVSVSDSDTATAAEGTETVTGSFSDTDTASAADAESNSSGGLSVGSVNSFYGVVIGFTANAFDTTVQWTRIDDPSGVS